MKSFDYYLINLGSRVFLFTEHLVQKLHTPKQNTERYQCVTVILRIVIEL